MAAAVDEALALEAEAAQAEQAAAQAAPRTPPLRGFTFVVAGFDASEAAALHAQLFEGGAAVLDAYPEDGDASGPSPTHLLCEDAGHDAFEAAREESKPIWSRQTLDAALRAAAAAPAPAAAAAAPAPPVLPASYVDRWDREHVRLPCSPRHRAHARRGAAAPPTLWHVLRDVLSPPPADADALLGAMKAVRDAIGGRWKLSALREYVTAILDDGDRARFFGATLPHLCALALRLPELCPDGLPLLRRGHASAVRLSADTCGCLLALAFFCAFPGREETTRGGGHGHNRALELPYFSFGYLHGPMGPPHTPGSSLARVQIEKFRCLFAYFDVLAERADALATAKDAADAAGPFADDLISAEVDAAAVGAREITFERLVADTSELELDGGWSSSEAPLCALRAAAAGTIEDDGAGMVEVDFANRIVGGGVLRSGCVQEEIRFLICPELIVSRLLAEGLGDNEAIRVVGFERVSNYRGYGSQTFEYGGRCEGGGGGGGSGEGTTLVAIDATHFGRDEHARARQYTPPLLERELNKAYAGFADGGGGDDGGEGGAVGAPVITGNWGCGAFGGDVQLKAVLQLLAASHARRPAVVYLTFGDENFARDLAALPAALGEAGLATVGAVVRLLRAFPPAAWPPRAEYTTLADLFGYLAAGGAAPVAPETPVVAGADDDTEPQEAPEAAAGGGGDDDAETEPQEVASQGAESQESLPYASPGGSQGSQQYATQETPLSEESGVAFGPVVHTS